MTTYISGTCANGDHGQDDLPNGSRFGSIPPCSCDCHSEPIDELSDEYGHLYRDYKLEFPSAGPNVRPVEDEPYYG